MPLVVLERGVSPYRVAGRAPSAANRAIERVVAAMDGAIARRSTRGEARVVARAGHDIQIDRPQAVVAAVAQVLAER